MQSEKVEFPGHSGELLAGRLDVPDGPPRSHALFAHCFTCTKDIASASRIARALTEAGIAVLRFDFTGLGHSKGEFANTNFSSNVDDLTAAARHMEERGIAPSLLIGHSLGGAAVIAAAGGLDPVRAVVTLGAPADPGHLARLFQGSEAEIEEKGEATVQLVGRPFTIRRQFLEDIRRGSILDHAGSLRRALLVMHAPRDDVVGIENAGAIFGAAKHPKSFISLDDADHLITRKRDSEYVARTIASWASRYLPEAGDGRTGNPAASA